MSREERVTVADLLVGRSADDLERVRIRQHEPPGTPRDELTVQVAESVTKACDIEGADAPPLVELFRQLYLTP